MTMNRRLPRNQPSGNVSSTVLTGWLIQVSIGNHVLMFWNFGADSEDMKTSCDNSLVLVESSCEIALVRTPLLMILSTINFQKIISIYNFWGFMLIFFSFVGRVRGAIFSQKSVPRCYLSLGLIRKFLKFFSAKFSNSEAKSLERVIIEKLTIRIGLKSCVMITTCAQLVSLFLKDGFDCTKRYRGSHLSLKVDRPCSWSFRLLRFKLRVCLFLKEIVMNGGLLHSIGGFNSFNWRRCDPSLPSSSTTVPWYMFLWFFVLVFCFIVCFSVQFRFLFCF